MSKRKLIVVAIGVIIIAGMFIFGRIFTIQSIDVVFVNQSVYADEEQILEASGLDVSMNIFNISENQIKKNIRASYSDNSIEVTDIERVFPNKVIIKVRERVPILLIEVEGRNTVLPTDKNFQMTREYAPNEITYDVIRVTNVKVENTFDTETFRDISEIISSFASLKYNDNAIVSFIDGIKCNDRKYELHLRDGSGVLVIDKTSDVDVETQLTDKVSAYLALDNEQRRDLVL